MSASPDRSQLHWYKSSRSAGNGNCVEVAELPSALAVRDSKDPEGPVLTFRAESWRLFVAAVRTGAFDTAADR
jgi:Domain of unknown function (DUF397)